MWRVIFSVNQKEARRDDRQAHDAVSSLTDKAAATLWYKYRSIHKLLWGALTVQ